VSRRVGSAGTHHWRIRERITAVKKLLAGLVACGIVFAVGCSGSTSGTKLSTVKKDTGTTTKEEKKDAAGTETKKEEKKEEPKKD
jgi:hypothetical protein